MRKLSKTSPTVQVTVRIAKDIRDEAVAAGIRVSQVGRKAITRAVVDHRKIKRREQKIKEEIARAAAKQAPSNVAPPLSERTVDDE